MTQPPPGPFKLLKDTPTSSRPPLLVDIANQLGKMSRLELLAEQVLKRQQQTALMVDGLGSTMGRRIDVLHEELAILRVELGKPPSSSDPAIDDTLPIPLTVETSSRGKVKHAVAVCANIATYATTATVAIKWLLGVLQ